MSHHILRLHGTVSLEILGGAATPILSKGTKLPAEAVRSFSTATDNQAEVEIQLFFGENQYTVDNLKLGSFIFQGIVPAPRGVPRIDILVRVDEQRWLSVHATEVFTGRVERLGQIDLAGLEPPPERREPSFASMDYGSNADIQFPLQITFEESVVGAVKTIVHPDTGRPLEIKIPAGIPPGAKIRLVGEGRAQAGSQQRGNLFIAISVVEHPFFVRANNDLILHIPIESRFAKSGGQIRAPKLQTGQYTSFNIPAGVKNGDTFCIRGGGVASLKDGRYGDLILHIEIYHSFWKSPKIKRRLEFIRRALGGQEIEA
jgi:hypothetical protein